MLASLVLALLAQLLVADATAAVLPATREAQATWTPYGRPERLRIGLPLGAYSAASAGNRVEVLFLRDFPADRLSLTRSDGRGIHWDPQRVIHSGTSSSLQIFESSYRLLGEASYVAWSESIANPSNEVEPFFMRSSDGGETFSTPLMLDKGSLPVTGSVRLMDMAVTRRPTGHVIHVLMQASDDQPASSGDGDLYLVTSRDGGQSFSAALTVTSPSAASADVESIVLAVDDEQVYVAWTDDRNDLGGEKDVFFRRSLDGGQSWAEAERQLTGATPSLPKQVSNDYPRLFLLHQDEDVVVAWNREDASFRYSVRAAASADGGESFAPARTVGGYTPGIDSAYLSDGGADQDRFYLTWSDRRSGAPVVYVAHSTDGGHGWTEVPARVPDPFSVPAPRLCAQDELVGLVFQENFGDYTALASLDGGLSWTQPVFMGMPEVSRLEPRIVFDSTYRNFVALWTIAPGGGSNELFTGGFRPQTLLPVGFASGADEVSFAFEGFTGAFPQVFVLASDAPGDFLLPTDDRNLGLRPGPLLLATIHGADGFDSTVNPLGRGMTLPRPPPALTGLTLYLAAAAFDPNHFAFGSLTDVVPLRFP